MIRIIAGVCALLLTAPAAHAQQDGIARREVFFAGGRSVGPRGAESVHGQMYVEALWPRRARMPYPLVLLHDAGQTGAGWLQTPDGRKGWAAYFAEQGYRVYLVDLPAHGRSAWRTGIDGGLKTTSVAEVERQITAPGAFRAWPQAERHTQWPGEGPGKGRSGDPVFDAFYKAQVDTPASPGELQLRAQEAGAALLDTIGPAILITHGASGPVGWALAEARPHYVKGIVALEPAGPPFEQAITGSDKARAWGVSDLALTYIPPAASPADLATQRQEKAAEPGLVPCIQQKEPARRLTNLAGVRTLLVTSEASAHAGFDHCTAAYLKQAGVPVESLRLAERGIKGNGHMMMAEKNSLEVAAALHGWMRKTITRTMAPPR